MRDKNLSANTKILKKYFIDIFLQCQLSADRWEGTIELSESKASNIRHSLLNGDRLVIEDGKHPGRFLYSCSDQFCLWFI